MKEWQNTFDIIQEPRVFTASDGNEFEIQSYYVVFKRSNEKVFPKTRKYGYSRKEDACRGAAHMYKNYLKEFEEALLTTNN